VLQCASVGELLFESAGLFCRWTISLDDDDDEYVDETTDRRWNRKEVSRGSSVDEEIRTPSSEMKS